MAFGISLQSCASAVISAVMLTAVFRSQPPPAPYLHRLPDDQARAFYKGAAEAEVTARKNAAGRFRGSPWSQDDEFHSKEAKFVRAYAKSHKVPISSLIEALDHGMREHWPTPEGASPDLKVIPCRPRLNY